MLPLDSRVLRPAAQGQGAELVDLGDEAVDQLRVVADDKHQRGDEPAEAVPAGDWYDWWTGAKLAGGRWIERPVDLATMPIYARAGAVVPLDPVRQYTGQSVDGPTTLRVYPGANGAFTLYDDDGHSTGYRDGSDPKTTWLRFRWEDAGRRLTIEPDARMKRWPGGVRTFSVEADGGDAKPKQVEFRGERVEVTL